MTAADVNPLEYLAELELPVDVAAGSYPEIEDPELDTQASQGLVELNAANTLKDLEPLTVLYILHTVFEGTQWWELEPDAIFDAIASEYGIEFSQADRDMVQGLMVLRNDESFWTEWEIFNFVIQALSGEGTNFNAIPLLDPLDMITAMDTATAVANLEGAIADYSKEVISYIAVTCLERGYWVLPPPLEIAQERVIQLVEINGWPRPNPEAVKADVEEGRAADRSTEAGLQAKLLLYLVTYRYRRMQQARREIRNFSSTRSK